MKQKRNQNESDYLPKQGNPLQETVCYRSGGTELLHDKMVRFIRSEAIAASADKVDKPQYNKDSNLFVGRSLRKK